MKVIQRMVVVAGCFFIVNAAFAQGESYDLVVAVSVEPETRDKDEIYIDKLITGVDQEASDANLTVELIQENRPDPSDAVTLKEPLFNEAKPYIYMKVWSED
ncbi:MAG TPA: hypothetical protein ENH48_06300 [Halieaceae bacterium]|nr:hypothetical protein [Halieaceae bacterium]